MLAREELDEAERAITRAGVGDHHLVAWSEIRRQVFQAGRDASQHIAAWDHDGNARPPRARRRRGAAAAAIDVEGGEAPHPAVIEQDLVLARVREAPVADRLVVNEHAPRRIDDPAALGPD